MMRILSIAFTGMALAVGGLLALGVSDPAFAKSPKHAKQTSEQTSQQTPKDCKGRNEAFENGRCIVTSNENPDHIPLDATTTPFYRSSATNHHHKKQKTHQS